MRIIQGVVLIVLVLISDIAQVSAVPEVQTLYIHQRHLKSKRHFIQDDDFLANPGQVFGTCYEMMLHPRTVKVRCTFMMETIKDINSLDHLRVCNFTLKSITNFDEKNYYIPLKVTALDRNKAFLTISFRDYKRFYILHFADCRAVNVNFGFINPRVAAPYDDRFDIIISKDGDYCNSKSCRLVLDTEGKTVVNMYDWLHEDSEIVAIAPSSLNGSIVVDKSQKQWRYSTDGLVRIYSVNRDGTIRIIKQYQAQAGPGVHYGAVTASTTYRRLTVCSSNKKNLTYAQFDWNGNLKFEGSWENDKISLIHTLRVHNVPNGGFILVITVCYKENNVKQCKKNGDNIFVKRFDSTGREVGTLDITSWKHIEVKKLHFYINNNRKMCLSNVNGHDVDYDGTIVLNVICFDDSDFAAVFL